MPEDIRTRSQDLATSYAQSVVDASISTENIVGQTIQRIISIAEEIAFQRNWTEPIEPASSADPVPFSQQIDQLKRSAQKISPVDLTTEKDIFYARFRDIAEVYGHKRRDLVSAEKPLGIAADIYSTFAQKLGFLSEEMDISALSDEIVSGFMSDEYNALPDNPLLKSHFLDHPSLPLTVYLNAEIRHGRRDYVNRFSINFYYSHDLHTTQTPPTQE